jgi:hypothetical protein
MHRNLFTIQPMSAYLADRDTAVASAFETRKEQGLRGEAGLSYVDELASSFLISVPKVSWADQRDIVDDRTGDIVITVPFEGDGKLFEKIPARSTFVMQVGPVVMDKNLVFRIPAADSGIQAGQRFKRQKDALIQNLSTIDAEVAAWNEQLRPLLLRELQRKLLEFDSMQSKLKQFRHEIDKP